MALTGSDLLVVQKQTGNKDVNSLSITDLASYLSAQSPLNFKGAANMTVSGDEPAVEDRVAGNVYINSATIAGAFAWTGGDDTFSGTVQPNAQAVWQETAGWQVVNNSSATVGVEEIQPAAPITVNDDTASAPIIGVSNASTSATGVVQIATDTDVQDGTEGKVVTSAQLKATNEAIGQAGGGTVTSVTGDAPIVITGTPAVSPKVTITGASTSAPGAVQLSDASAIDEDSTDLATTPKYVSDYYLIKNFSELTDVNA